MAKDPEWTVNTPSPAHCALMEALQLQRALYAGTPAMRALAENGHHYLPMGPKESQAAYNDRVAKTVLYNVYRRTVDSLVGRPYSREVTLGDDVPDQLQEWSENIDLEGRNLTIFGRDSLRDGLKAGMGSFLVEAPMPPTDAEGRVVRLNLADEGKAGVRPWLVHVPPDNLIWTKSIIQNGRRVLTQARIREKHTVEVGQWGEAEVPRVRVLYPGKWELYQASNDGSPEGNWAKPVLVSFGPSSLPYIPLFPYYTNQTGFFQCEPFLGDLAELNARHWQASSDLAHILHFTNFPVLFLNGKLVAAENDEGGEVEMGPNVLWNGEKDSDLKYVEHQGHSIGSLVNYLGGLEEQMSLLGMEPLRSRKDAAETAYGRALDSKETFSTLGVCVLSQRQAMEESMMAMAEMMKIKVERKNLVIDINTEFGITPKDAQDIDALKFARQNKDISREAYLKELQRRDTLDQDYDAEKDQELLDKESADSEMGALPGAGAFGKLQGLPGGKPMPGAAMQKAQQMKMGPQGAMA